MFKRGVAAALLVLLTASPARGEYVENPMGRNVAAITLGTAGAVAVGFDIAAVVYLARGPGDEAGRMVSGIGSLVAGNGLVAGAAMALSQVGEEHVPAGAGNEDSDEAVALRQARVLAGVDLALAALSLGLGTAALSTFRSDEPAPAATSWRLLPVVLGGDGAGIGCIGSF